MPRTLSICLVLALSSASLANAQDAPAPTTTGTNAGRDEEARGLFEAGRSAFHDGRFADARDYFRRAYELSGRAALLYDVGAAEDRLRNEEAALEAFDAYLAALPEADNHAEVEGRVAILRQAVEERRAEQAARLTAPVTPPPAASGPTLLWTWIAGGAALATGGAAIGTWVVANDQYGQLERGCFARGGCSDAEIDASGVDGLVTATNALMITSFVFTAATAAALVVELVVLPGASASEDTSASLRIGPGSIGVEGTF